MKIIEGQLKRRPGKIGIVVAKFNEFITDKLLEGCLDELKRLGVKDSQLVIARVPGSFEIPVIAQKMAKKKDVKAVICLGAVIRGETIHFELVANGSMRGISEVSLQTGKPVIFGVISTETVDQAYKRSQNKEDHKGREAARVALEMIDVLSQLSNNR